MLSMASKICLPSLKVVETENVPRVMVLRKSARFLPLKQETGHHIHNAGWHGTKIQDNTIKKPYLELHHHIVEAIVPATANKATHVIFACQKMDNLGLLDHYRWLLWS